MVEGTDRSGISTESADGYENLLIRRDGKAILQAVAAEPAAMTDSGWSISRYAIAALRKDFSAGDSWPLHAFRNRKIYKPENRDCGDSMSLAPPEKAQKHWRLLRSCRFMMETLGAFLKLSIEPSHALNRCSRSFGLSDRGHRLHLT
jgi:hypothetical protein